MAHIRIHGYTDRLNPKAGERITAYVSAEGTAQVRAHLVRLIHGDENPEGPGFIEREVDSAVNREWPVQRQYTQQGNYLTVADAGDKLALAGGPFTLYGFIYPTLPRAGRQVLLGRWDVNAQRGAALGLNAQGRLEFWCGDGERIDSVSAEVPLQAQQWLFVAASVDPQQGTVTLHQVPVVNRYNSLLSRIVPMDTESHVQVRLRVKPARCDGGFLVGGCHEATPARGPFVSCCFNGKIDRPGVLGVAADRATIDALRNGQSAPRDSVIAAWDTTAGYTERGIGDEVRDVGPYALHAMGVNRPVRCQTGWNWNGRNDCFRLAPQEYGGIEFHDDAMIDCRWAPTLTLDLPADLKSGCYALRLTAGVKGADATGQQAHYGEEYLPFFVRPSAPRARICMLMPTASYLAYANAQLSFEVSTAQAVTATVAVMSEVEIDYQREGLPYGLSTYDHHRDGAGVCYSSALRPILNMRPKCRMPGVHWPWQFPADLSIVAWLEHLGYEYDMLTDFDLHAEGVAALKPYSVVINGTHAEYYSERMLDATEDYLAQGGRVMYLSGNGYYWVVGFDEQEPRLMEVRKLEAGSRAWQAKPGEQYLATTGERSGLWRHRGRAPQKIMGTGFASEGMDHSVAFRRMPDSWHERVAWIFDGVEGDLIGDFGLAGNGAAGVEIDRYDLTLGTPPHAVILATSETFSDNYPLVQEEVMYMAPGMGGTQNPAVRCDMVYFTTREHGAVFAPSSIAWGQALPCKGFDNNVSRVMKNVLDAFVKPGPLPGSAFVAEEKLWR